MKINLTGHRPFQKDKKTGLWVSKLAYTDDTGVFVAGNTRQLYNRLVDLFTAYYRAHPEIEVVITGMAMGIDLAGARAAHNTGRLVHSYVPHNGHGQEWKTFYRQEHNEILDLADYVYAPDVPFSVQALLGRNEDMVNASDGVLAVWDGTPGGTGSCVRYAEKVGKPVVNLWSSWERYKGK